jgi:hypothetical protein
VRKIYLGRGAEAKSAARQVEERRQKRQAAREAWLQERAEIARAEEASEELCLLTDMILHAVLEGTGHHLHRGEWRKSRNVKGGDDTGA